MRALVIALCFISLGCTIAPKNVHQTQASFSSTGQDSGIRDETAAPKEGFPVNQEWIEGYDRLLEKYGNRLFPVRTKGDRAGIAKEGDHYRISDSVMERQQEMNQLAVNETP